MKIKVAQNTEQMIGGNLQVFKNNLFRVAAKLEDGEILFDAETVASSLGLVGVSTKSGGKKYEWIRWDRVNEYLGSFATFGEIKKGDFIPEPIVYKLAFKAGNEVAERFQDWLALDVLPSIRKHGAYMTENVIEEALTNPDLLIRLATNLKEEKAARLEAEKQIEKQKPKVIFADALEVSKNTILVGELAKLLKQNGVNIGAKRLFVWLRENGYLIKRKGSDNNMPTQYSMDLGLFEVKETSITHSDGHIIVNKTPKVTGKGQIYFINKFKKN